VPLMTSSRPGYSTHATTGRKIEQTTGSSDYSFVNQGGRCRIICLDICEDGIAIRQRKPTPP
jgi:hypothetical protein